jgi:hypothetical protein
VKGRVGTTLEGECGSGALRAVEDRAAPPRGCGSALWKVVRFSGDAFDTGEFRGEVLPSDLGVIVRLHVYEEHVA